MKIDKSVVAASFRCSLSGHTVTGFCQHFFRYNGVLHPISNRTRERIEKWLYSMGNESNPAVATLVDIGSKGGLSGGEDSGELLFINLTVLSRFSYWRENVEGLIKRPVNAKNKNKKTHSRFVRKSLFLREWKYGWELDFA